MICFFSYKSIQYNNCTLTALLVASALINTLHSVGITVSVSVARLGHRQTCKQIKKKKVFCFTKNAQFRVKFCLVPKNINYMYFVLFPNKALTLSLPQSRIFFLLDREN
jgi:hypothetical protein